MWYTGLKVTQKNFRGLAINFGNLIFELAKDVQMYEDAGLTSPAACDLTKRHFIVHSGILNNSHSFFDTTSPANSLEVVGGIFVHEGAHLAFSPVNWIKLFGADCSWKVLVANVFEDIAIESLAVLRNKNFGYLLTKTNELLFSEKEIKKRQRKTTGEKPQTPEEFTDYLNYLITWKRSYPVFPRTDFEKQVYSLFMSAIGMECQNQRAETIKRIYRLLEIDGSSEEEGSAEGSAEGSEETGSEAFDEIERKSQELLKDNNLAASSSSDHFLVLRVPNFSNDSNIDSGYCVSRVPTVEGKFPYQRFRGFEQIEIGRQSQRSVKGLPSEVGKKLRHLNHLEDGRVFSTALVDGGTHGKIKPQVIILIDLSGSMNSRRGGSTNSNFSDSTKLHFALENMLGLADSLRECGIEFGVYGHTTNWNLLPPTTLKHVSPSTIFEFQKTGERSDLEKQALWIKKYNNGNANADGEAIKFVCKKFTQNEKRILIVISDGAPSASDDPSISAMDYAKKVVEVYKKEGIGIFSLAIDRVAISPCEFIYGKEFSTFVDDREKFVKSIIRFTE